MAGLGFRDCGCLGGLAGAGELARVGGLRGLEKPRRVRALGLAQRHRLRRRRTRGSGGLARIDRRGAGRGVALDADEDDVRAAQLTRHDVDRVGVVALQGAEPAVFDVAGQEPYVAVGAEVGPAAPVIGRDVPGPRLVCADELETVAALLGVAHPIRDTGPAAARHLVPGLLQRPGHERRTPRVSRRDPRRLQIPVDLRARVGAPDLASPALGLSDAQRRGTDRASTAATRTDHSGIRHRACRPLRRGRVRLGRRPPAGRRRRAARPAT